MMVPLRDSLLHLAEAEPDRKIYMTPMASKLMGMASTLVAMASNLIAEVKGHLRLDIASTGCLHMQETRFQLTERVSETGRGMKDANSSQSSFQLQGPLSFEKRDHCHLKSVGFRSEDFRLRELIDVACCILMYWGSE